MQAALASQPCGRGGGPALPQTLADRLAAEDSRALSDSGASSDSEGTSFYTAASGVELPQPGAAMNPNSTSYQSLAGFEGVQAPDTLSPLGQVRSCMILCSTLSVVPQACAAHALYVRPSTWAVHPLTHLAELSSSAAYI